MVGLCNGLQSSYKEIIANFGPRLPTPHPKCHPSIRRKEVYTKGVCGSEKSSASTGKNEVWFIPKSLFSRETEGNAYTPKSLQGVCWGPLHAALVYRFRPPIPGKTRGTGPKSGTEKQPKEKVFGLDIPWTSWVIRVDVPDQNFRQVLETL